MYFKYAFLKGMRYFRLTKHKHDYSRSNLLESIEEDELRKCQSPPCFFLYFTNCFRVRLKLIRISDSAYRKFILEVNIGEVDYCQPERLSVLVVD